MCFGTNVPKKSGKKKFELCQNNQIFRKISEIYQVAKCSNSLKLYKLKVLLSKNWFHFFFSSSDMQKLHHLSGYHPIGINSLVNSFLSALTFSNLICQAKILTRMIVSGSSSSQLVSPTLILLRSILRISILLQENKVLPESSLRRFTF